MRARGAGAGLESGRLGRVADKRCPSARACAARASSFAFESVRAAEASEENESRYTSPDIGNHEEAAPLAARRVASGRRYMVDERVNEMGRSSMRSPDQIA
eukprot:scaffold5640_cov30-Tisochrysis_lutea.AAC.9